MALKTPALASEPWWDARTMQMLRDSLAARDVQLRVVLDLLAEVAVKQRCTCPPVWDEARRWYNHYDGCFITRIRKLLNWS